MSWSSSAAGSALRHGVGRAASATLGSAFPFGTVFINVAGSFAMGVLAAVFLAKDGSGQAMRLFLATGVLGGFTTFSAFSLESASLLQKGEWPTLAAYVGGSVFLSIAALFVGMATVRALG